MSCSCLSPLAVWTRISFPRKEDLWHPHSIVAAAWKSMSRPCSCVVVEPDNGYDDMTTTTEHEG